MLLRSVDQGELRVKLGHSRALSDEVKKYVESTSTLVHVFTSRYFVVSDEIKKCVEST